MGTAAEFDKTLKKELNIHAAWIPISNTFKLGDYGVVSDGVFTKEGNIGSDFGVSIQPAIGPSLKLNFTSEGTTETRFAGSAKIDAFPESDVEAKFRIEFSNASSFLLKANLAVLAMENVGQVAKALASHPDWRHRYRVVSNVYSAKDCALISSTSAGSKIEFSGAAKALKQFDLGAVALDVGVSSKSEIGLDIVGKTGVVGLSYFKLKWWSGAPKTLADGEPELELSANAKTLEDDI